MTSHEADSSGSSRRDTVPADPAGYTKLVVSDGTPAEAHRRLGHLTPEQSVQGLVKSHAAANAALAGLWLWHDGLEECHQIVQKAPGDFQSAPRRSASLEVLETPAQPTGGAGASLAELTATFAFWHAIMHRREGDFGNSKYWYRRCAGHGSYSTMAMRADDVLKSMPADKLLLRLTINGWDPMTFVDLVEKAHGLPFDAPLHKTAVTLQKIEWQALMEWTTRAATGQ